MNSVSGKIDSRMHHEDKMRNESSNKNTASALERRTFLKFLIVALNAVIGVTLAIPGLGYLLTPILARSEHGWLEIGRVTDISAVEFSKTMFQYVSSAGYVREKKKRFVWTRREEDGAVTAFSPKCTHMGCNVAWNSGSRRFECPCHGGRYDEQGRVLAGPPPRPLERYETRIENDIVFLKESKA